MRPAVAVILADVARWARSRADIHGLALVGSYASGKARPDSDLDVIILADAPEAYEGADWVQCAIGQRRVVATRKQRFGNVWSLFVALAEDPVIEFTFAERSWAKSDPPAPEVCRIVRDGMVVLCDPLGELLRLSKACGVKPQSDA
jgi:hypothetical protein